MAVNRSIKKALPAGISILCLFILILSSHAAYAGVASVSALSGAVYLKEKDGRKWAVAEKGFVLNVGDTVKTGADGRAMIEFTDGMRLSSGNDSELAITKFYLASKG